MNAYYSGPFLGMRKTRKLNFRRYKEYS